MRLQDWLMPSALSRLLLFSSATYILFVSIAVTCIDPIFPSFYAIYYLLVLIGVVYCAYRSFYEINDLNERASRSSIIYFAVMMVFMAVSWWAYRRLNFFEFPIWFDELTQYAPLWRLNDPVDPTVYAALQQQPPIDYYLSHFFFKIFGLKEFPILFHAILFGGLSLLAFGLWLQRVAFPLPLVPVALLIFCAQASLLRYSAEARPISIGVFFAVLTLQFAYESFKTQKVQKFSLLASSLLLLYSMGLQPLFFLPFVAFAFDGLRFRKVTLYSFIVPLLISLPNIYKVYVECLTYDQFQQGSHFKNWLNGLAQLNLSSFELYYRALYGVIATLLLPIAAIALCLIRKSWTRELAALLGGLLFIFGVPVLFQIFWATINWELYPHYIILWPVGTFAFLAFAVAFINAQVPERYFQASLLALCLATVFGIRLLNSEFVPEQNKIQRLQREGKVDWRKIIDFDKNPNRALYITVPFNHPLRQNHFDYLGGILFSNEQKLVFDYTLHNMANFEPVSISEDLVPLIPADLIRKFRREVDVYFVFLFDHPDDLPMMTRITDYFSGKAEVTYLTPWRIIVKFSQPKSSRKLMHMVFNDLVNLDPSSSWNALIYKTMATDYLSLNDFQSFYEIVQKMKALNMSQKESAQVGVTQLYQRFDKFLHAKNLDD